MYFDYFKVIVSEGLLPTKALLNYESYKDLYTLEREQVLADFQNNSPHLSEFEAEMERYERLESEITQLPSQQSLTAAIQLSNGRTPCLRVTLQVSLHLCSLSRASEASTNSGSTCLEGCIWSQPQLTLQSKHEQYRTLCH